MELGEANLFLFFVFRVGFVALWQVLV